MPDTYAGRLGTAATAAASPSPVAAAGKAEEGPSAEEKETDAAAVTAVIWKELAEMSAAQAKLKVWLPHLSRNLADAAVMPACIMTGHSSASFHWNERHQNWSHCVSVRHRVCQARAQHGQTH